MEPTRFRMPLRLRGALLALLMAAMATQVSGASAAQEMGSARLVTAGVAATAALSDERAQLTGLAGLLRGPPASGGWGLLVAGLIGVWAIGHRRMSVLGSRSLDPHGLRHR
ncbi:MAG TPA: hypothetical protein VGH61_12510 [Steroidobacteraceae bacterium]|jgi:hypothetical protein